MQVDPEGEYVEADQEQPLLERAQQNVAAPDQGLVPSSSVVHQDTWEDNWGALWRRLPLLQVQQNK